MPKFSYSNNANPYNQGLVQMIDNFEGHYFVTFVFNRELSIEAAVKNIEHFQAMLDRKIIGPRWLKHEKKRSQYIAIAENVSTNLHFHAVFRVLISEETFRLRATEIWREIMPSGNVDIQPIYDQKGVSEYVTKQMNSNLSCHLFPSKNASHNLK